MPSLPPLRSYLYAPGTNARLLEKVFSAGADAVILDLEDSVPAEAKGRAREAVARALHDHPPERGRPAVFVRVNHPASGLADEDVAAVVQPGLDGLRLPKVEEPGGVVWLDELTSAAEARAGLPAEAVAFVCTVETAAGVCRAKEIARACGRVLGLAFGQADFALDVGATVESEEGLETLYARSSLVMASRVARCRPPVDSVYTRLNDLQGLERTTRQGRALGFFGRSAVHPRQVPIINQVYTPTEDALAWARRVLSAAAEAEAVGVGALRLDDGDFVDRAIVRRAEEVIALAEALEDHPESTTPPEARMRDGR